MQQNVLNSERQAQEADRKAAATSARERSQSRALLRQLKRDLRKFDANAQARQFLALASKNDTSVLSNSPSSTVLPSVSVSEAQSLSSLSITRPPAQTTQRIPGDFGLPIGCPYDLDYYIELEPFNPEDPCRESTKSIIAAKKHTECTTCNVGNETIERYVSLLASADESGLYGFFGADQDYSAKLMTKADVSSLSLFSASKSYLDTGVKESEAYLWGYVNNGEGLNMRCRIDNNADGLVEVWDTTSGGFSKLYVDPSASKVGFSCSLNEDYSYLTQNTLGIFYANGDFATLVPADLQLGYSSGDWSRLYGAGLWLEKGGVYVDIRPPEKNAYFQTVEVITNVTSAASTDGNVTLKLDKESRYFLATESLGDGGTGGTVSVTIPKGEKGDPGVDGINGTNGTNGKDGYTPIKGVDYFDGKDGKDGINGTNGTNGIDGKDGYTPIKGVDYFDGKDGINGTNGIDGKDGYTPIKGVDYFDGKDGINGTNGIDGKDGYTPIKGVDYFDGKDGQDADPAAIEALQAEQAVQNGRLDALAQDIAALTEQATQFELVTDGLRTDVTDLVNQATALGEEVDSVVTRLEELNQGTIERFNALGQRVDGLDLSQAAQDGRLSAIESALAALSPEQLEALQQQIAAIQGEQTTQNTRLDALETSQASQDAVDLALQTEIALASAKIAALELGQTAQDNRLSGVEGAQSQLSGRVGTLESEVSQLSGRVGTLESEVSQLETDVSELDSDLSSLSADVEGVKDSIATLNTNTEQLDTKIETVASDLAASNNELEAKLTAVQTALELQMQTLVPASYMNSLVSALSAAFAAHARAITNIDNGVTNIQVKTSCSATGDVQVDIDINTGNIGGLEFRPPALPQ